MVSDRLITQIGARTAGTRVAPTDVEDEARAAQVTLAEVEGQLLQWTRALMQWAQGDPDGVLDPDDD